MLTHEEIKEKHDKAYTYNQVTRERAADDLVFYWVTQWDDALLDDTQLSYRGEFNILRKAGRDIISNLDSNPVQVDFEPINENRDDAADVLDGLYRSDEQNNSSAEAYENGRNETVVCGVGAWELCTEYESIRGTDNYQKIKRKPIYEANNTVFWDPQSKRLDKADAGYCSVLESYTEQGYSDLYEKLTGKKPESIDESSFANPEQSFAFPWISGGGKKIYISRFFHVQEVKEKLIVFTDPFGEERVLRERDVLDHMDEMISAGYEIDDEREETFNRVMLYIVSGREIISSQEVAGEHIPVVPMYGERAIIEGEEHYEGITNLAKDPQRLRNFQLSYLADIVSRSPRTKPVFFPEQLKGFEYMYNETGADNNYPYYFQNRLDEQGQPLPVGPIATMPEQPVPTALIQSINLSREAVEDVANAGVPQDIADPDLSGKAVLALQNKIDMQSMVYQEHLKHAKKRDGEIYASMAREIYDVPRRVTMTLPDGNRKRVQIMETVIDNETGEIVTLNDISNTEFNVYSDIGPSYNSKKEQTRETLTAFIRDMDHGDPLRNIMILQVVRMVDGADLDDVRDYANMQLILAGVKKPETEEEKQQYAIAQQQGSQPSAEMVLAMAEDKKGQAALMKEQRENVRFKVDAILKEMGINVDKFKAQTDRLNTQIDAQEAGANIDYKRADTFGKQIDNASKIINLRDPRQMSNDELMSELIVG